MALLNGYEVEPTPEQKVFEEWAFHDPDDVAADEFAAMRFHGFREGMKFTLDAYGIKVKGIND